MSKDEFTSNYESQRELPAALVLRRQHASDFGKRLDRETVVLLPLYPVQRSQSRILDHSERKRIS